MVQWLRIHLTMQRTQVQSVVGAPTCHRATKIVGHKSPGTTLKAPQGTTQTHYSQINKDCFIFIF